MDADVTLLDRTLANEFHSISPREARVLLFDGGDRVLKAFAPALAERASRQLEKLGVQLHFGVHVSDVRRDGITVTAKADGASSDYAVRTVLWTAGVEAVPFARHAAEVFGATTDRSGRIAVAADLSIPGHPDVFVVGDLAGRDGLPGVAENAMQGGLHVAACIRRDLECRPRKDFRYRDLGSAAYISRGRALLQAGPIKLTGLLGWGFIHIAFLTGLRNRFSTVGTSMATIARADRSDRTFILGGSGHPEEPYTWESPVHQGHHWTRREA